MSHPLLLAAVICTASGMLTFIASSSTRRERRRTHLITCAVLGFVAGIILGTIGSARIEAKQKRADRQLTVQTPHTRQHGPA